MKLEIAKELWQSCKTKSSKAYKVIAKKCYQTFVVKCILLGRRKYKMKFSTTPNEFILYYITEKCGLKITDEHFSGRSIIYDVVIE